MESELLEVWNYYLGAFGREETISLPANKAGLAVLAELRRRFPKISSEQCVEAMTAAIDRAQHLVRTQPTKVFFARWLSIFGKFDTFYSLWDDD
jgi:hypothetical protein